MSLVLSQPTEKDPALICPKDGVVMERFDADGIAVDRCPECGGIWLDLGELRALLDRPPEAAPLITLLDRPERRVQKRSTRNPREEWLCPRDGARLVSMRDPRQPHIEYEVCTVCGGVFFDAGELADLSRYTLLERLRSIVG